MAVGSLRAVGGRGLHWGGRGVIEWVGSSLQPSTTAPRSHAASRRSVQDIGSRSSSETGGGGEERITALDQSTAKTFTNIV